MFNEQVTTADGGYAVWNQVFPTSPEGLYHFYIEYPGVDFGSAIEFDILFGNPVIEGIVTFGFPEDLLVPSGTEVRVYSADDGSEFSVTTDSSGFYTTASHSLPFGTYYVFAEIDNCLEILQTVEVEHIGVYERDLHIFCPMIHGKVMSPAGPVADAEVTLSPGGEIQITSTEGDYVFVVTPTSLPESYTVNAEKDGYAAFPTIEYVTLTEDNPIGVANFCWTGPIERGSPGDDYVYYPEHFSTPGFDPSHANMSGMPEESIDTFTGKVNLAYTDLSLPGKGGLDLNVIRTYSSCIKERSPWADDNIYQQNFVPETSLGLGWDITFGRILHRLSDTPVIVMPDGSRHVAYSVPHSGGDGYPKYTDNLWRLEKINVTNDDHDMLLTTTDGIQYYFDRSDFYTETDVVYCWHE